MLRSGDLDPTRAAHALEVIERNARLQSKLIEDLLDVSRIISGKVRLQLAPVDLGAVLDTSLDAARAAADLKGIQLHAFTERPLPAFIGDSARLQQVFSNLLANAVKFTPPSGTVEVHLRNLEGAAELEVSDNGRGIDPSFLPYIFERFRQADSSTTRSEAGLGLGLAIVEHLVRLHGGVVTATSQGLGCGATFSVRLPLLVESSRAEHRAPAAPAAPAGEAEMLAEALILVIDDDDDAREAIAEVLTACGAQVITCSTVEEGLARIGRQPVDLVVSDIAMPNLDGYALIRELRNNLHEQLPALALTACGESDEQQRILSAGFDGYLAKPFETAALVRTVRSLLQRNREE